MDSAKAKPNNATEKNKRFARRLLKLQAKAQTLAAEMFAEVQAMEAAGIPNGWIATLSEVHQCVTGANALGWTARDMLRCATPEEARRADQVDHWSHILLRNPERKAEAERELADLGVNVRASA